jgi:DNA-binding transcriptional ArsR family regulator
MASKTVQQADSDVFTAIAHPVRRQILDRLLAGDEPVNRLAGAFPMSRPAISQHLRVLREVSLVREERRGRERYYSLNPQGLDEVRAWMRKYERFWRDRLQALGAYLNEEGDA